MSDKTKSFEFEGASVEDAIKKATTQLNISRDDMDVKVVSEEKKGLFGMGGAKPAKILVILKN